MNLGLLVDKSQFLLQNFMRQPHALFVGAMGTGKSIASRYETLFSYEQVKLVLSSSQVHGVIDLLYKK